jgi:hypothetical protein
MEEIIHGSIDALRNHPRVGRGIPIVVAVLMTPIFLEHEDVFVMSELGSYRVPMTRSSFELMREMTRSMVLIDMVCIPWDSIAFSTSRATTTMRDHRESLHRHLNVNRSVDEDLAVAFMICIYWRTAFCIKDDHEYARFRDRYPESAWVLTAGVVAN